MKLIQGVGGALAVALALLLAACGPGVGGTGTGSVPEPGAAGLQFFGATPQNVCSAAFASILGCAAVTGGDTPVLTVERHFAAECAAASFVGDEVTLDALCAGWVFIGRWGLAADGAARFYGLVGADPALPPTVPATLEVQAQGSDLVLWLRAADGQVLAGPLQLSAVGS